MELKARALEESDWATLQEWWDRWKWPKMNRDLLPLNGLGGLIVCKGDTPIVAGYLYLTNSKVAWMEWIISNKDYREDDRKEAMEMLILGLEDIALSVDKSIILSVGRNVGLINVHKKLGYTVDDKASYEISKKLI
tara:strand:+ start:2156 stop:2563 length:408 start_codon:yes stop_codon:yes gene_type:complete